jgi:hypothetical protein
MVKRAAVVQAVPPLASHAHPLRADPHRVLGLPGRMVTAPLGERDWSQSYRDLGYDWCRPCQEWHRPPECAIDQDGEPVDEEM